MERPMSSCSSDISSSPASGPSMPVASKKETDLGLNQEEEKEVKNNKARSTRRRSEEEQRIKKKKKNKKQI